MQFAYEAKSGPHQIVRGELEAENERAAVEQLTAKGLFLTSIRPAKQSVYPTPISKSSAASSKVSAKNLSLFTTQMSDLLGAGLTVVKSLDIITTQTNHARLKEIVGRIRDSVKEGKSFSASLAAFPSLFNSFYINMVRAGETGGTLGEVFEHLSATIDKELELRRKVLQSLAYPLFVAGFGAVTIFGILTFLIPKISEIFEESRQSLPIITRAVLGVSLLFQEFWWIVIGALIVFFFIFRQGLRQGRFNQQISNFIWRVPLFGDMSQKEDLSRLTRSLAMLLKNGVSILEALSVSKDIVRNGTLSAEVRRIQEEVSHGSSLSQSFSRSSLFPPLMVNLTAIGEETGALDRSLLRVADVYDKEVDGLSKTITTLLGPVMILIVGLFIFILLLSVLLPIFQINLLVQ
jgi:type II secretory pathway component PulF